MTQGTDTLAPWLLGSQRRYPDNPLYAVSWESKRLASLGSLAASGAVSAGTWAVVRKFARRALSNAGIPVAHLASFTEVVKNPWHVAMAKAAMTGILLADLIARTDHPDGFVLMGHSLGARVAYYALEALGTRDGACVQDAYLLGGAVGRGDADAWELAAKGVAGRIYNFHSDNDQILQRMYKIANAFTSDPIGLGPIESSPGTISNVDVSDLVSGHTQYKPELTRVLARIDELAS